MMNRRSIFSALGAAAAALFVGSAPVLAAEAELYRARLDKLSRIKHSQFGVINHAPDEYLVVMLDTTGSVGPWITVMTPRQILTGELDDYEFRGATCFDRPVFHKVVVDKVTVS